MINLTDDGKATAEFDSDGDLLLKVKVMGHRYNFYIRRTGRQLLANLLNGTITTTPPATSVTDSKPAPIPGA